MSSQHPLNLRQLRCFVAVAEELHFGRAAARVGIAQPPLSAQIKGLEQRLGTRLLERSKRQVRLTSSGRVLLAEASRLLAHSDRVCNVMARAKCGEAGDLYLGCVPSGLYGILPRIMRAMTESLDQPRMIVREAHTAEIGAAVLDGRMDAGLVWDDHTAPPLAIRALERVQFVVALPTGHALTAVDDVALSDLASAPLILPPREVSPHQFDRIIAGFRRTGIHPIIGHEVGSIPSELGFVAAGLGYALVPTYAQKLAMEGVVFKPLRVPLESVPLSVIWNSTRDSPQLELFLRRLAEAFAPVGDVTGHVD